MILRINRWGVLGVLLGVCLYEGSCGRMIPVHAQTPPPDRFAELTAKHDSLQQQIDHTMDHAQLVLLDAEIVKVDDELTDLDRAAIVANTAAMNAGVAEMKQALASSGVAVATYGVDAGMALPDPAVTPGAVDPAAVADLSGKQHLVDGIERNVCAKDFRTGPIRARIRDFPKLKREACTEYGIAKCDKSVEGDHLISIEIGGCPDCLTNQWPQPMDQARVKDHQVEDILPKLVCGGQMTLPEAQKCIAGDWVKCGEKIKALTGGSGT